VHRIFYGIAGVVLGILSFPASNLGGFFLGMLLAITGGSMAFAWTPLEQPPLSAVTTGPTLPVSDEAADLGGLDQLGLGGDKPDGQVHRLLAAAAIPLALLAGLFGANSSKAADPLTAPQPTQTCVLVVICLPAPSHTATPVPTRRKVPARGKEHKQRIKLGTAQSGLVASSATSIITAGTATVAGFTYQGLVEMPTSGGGTTQMMEFTANSIILGGGVTSSVTQGTSTTLTTSPTLAFTGDVVLYTTSLSGCVDAGSGPSPVCLDLTPGSVQTGLDVLAGYLGDAAPLTLSNVVVDQPLTSADSLTSGTLTVDFG
jgi:hypothetical protein